MSTATTTDGIHPKIIITISVPPCVAQALKDVVSEKAHPRRDILNQVVKSVTITTSIVIVPFMLMNLMVCVIKILMVFFFLRHRSNVNTSFYIY